MSLLKAPIFCILLLTASSESFWLKKKVLEEIRAESQALKFLKSVKYEPSNGCLKFKRGFEMLISEMRENDFVKSSDFSHFAAHSFIWQLWSENKSWREDPCGPTGFGIFKIRPGGAKLRLFEVHSQISDSEICALVYSPAPACFAAGTAQHYLVFHRMALRTAPTHHLITAHHLLNEIDQ